MHLLLTDRLSCPRCGPPHGLILLADRIDDRRVLRGELGCSNCRESYPVVEGFGDLRPPPRAALPPVERRRAEPTREEAVRLAALLGVAEGPGFLLLLGELSRHGPPLADLISDIEVVSAASGQREEPERPGVSRLCATSRLPFFPGTFRGVALSGADAADWLEAARRTLAPKSRLVVMPPVASTAEALREGGMEIVLDDPEALVAVTR